MSKLLEKLIKAGSVKHSSILDESPFFNAKDVIPTELPILNMAFSGDLDGGLVSGLTIFAGLSKSFKTLAGLYCLKAYLNKYDDAVAIIFDSEFSISPQYLKMYDIDPSRIIHVPIEHIEQLKFDIVKRLEQIERGDRVFILIDSIGSLSSKKEVEDAKDEKSVADMTRAKSLRSLLRIITPHLTMKDIPCIAINHVYQEQSMYPKTIVSGGTAIMYCANQVFIFSKSQEKGSDGELIGHNFTITIEKSRFVKEKSKFSFLVTYDGGIYEYSGLLDIAIDSGHILKSGGWYQIIDFDTGEILPNKIRQKDLNSDFWDKLIENHQFKDYVKKKFSLIQGESFVDEIIDEKGDE